MLGAIRRAKPLFPFCFSLVQSVDEPVQCIKSFTRSEQFILGRKGFANPSILRASCQFSSNSGYSFIGSNINVMKHSDEEHDDNDYGDSQTDDDVGFLQPRQLDMNDNGLLRDIDTIMDILNNFSSNSVEANEKLHQCGIVVTSSLVVEVLSRIRNDHSAAFAFFLWAGKQPDYSHSVREYHSMISILGKRRKFDTAWALIDEMRGGRYAPSLVTPQTLLIMIRRYAAVHDVGKAINTFYALKRFKFELGLKEFQDLLSALCRYKNVDDAEHFLFCNENAFPFNTKSFNIILNGWCNIMANLRESKRFWRNMCNRGIPRDCFSYGSIISCYSKASSLNDVLKLFNQMKELNISPDRKVYNSVIYALAKGNCVAEAINLVKTMNEKGISPNVVTYNSLIKPLCKARKVEQARGILNEMLERGIHPSIRTYHAFFAMMRTEEEVFELLDKMRQTRCYPTNDTYSMLIRKFCRWHQHENVFKLWSGMVRDGISPDRSLYTVLIHGLFLNGELEKASKYFKEMKEKGFSPEPKTDQLIEAWLSSKSTSKQLQSLDMKGGKEGRFQLKMVKRTNKSCEHKNFLKQPEIRTVTRERGFSLQ